MKERAELEKLAEKLPPMIARDHVEDFLGGVIAAKRLANLDSQGEGPERIRIGRKASIKPIIFSNGWSPWQISRRSRDQAN